MTYSKYIENLKAKWIGKNVKYEGKMYKVVDVDYNGGLLIDRQQYYCETYTASTTAIAIHQIEK